MSHDVELWNQAQRAARSHPQWPRIRELASQDLIDQGAQEVGTSDINHSVFALYKRYNGDFDLLLSDRGSGALEHQVTNMNNVNKLVAKLIGEEGGDSPEGTVGRAVPRSDTMSVGELRNFLEGFPAETPVFYGYPTGDHWRTTKAGSIKSGEIISVKHSDYHDGQVVNDEPQDDDRDVRDVRPDEALVLTPRYS